MSDSLLRRIGYMTAPQYVATASRVTHGQRVPSLFGHALLDQCSLTPWYVPSAYLLWVYAAYGSALPFLLGLAAWTAMEYAVHRFVFHFDIRPYAHLAPVRVAHFVLHGMHHAYPDDPLLLVLPPAFTLPLAYALSRVLPAAFFSGLLFGYVAYDTIHFWMHHVKHSAVWPFNTAAWRAARAHHMAHHFSDSSKGFGVSSPLWDWAVAKYGR